MTRASHFNQSQNWFALSLSGVAGSAVAFQARYNGELGTMLNNPYISALISCVVGLMVLYPVVLSTRGSHAAFTRTLASLRSGSLPFWLLSGGLSGAFLVLAQSAATKALGVSLFTVGVVAGQSLTGVLLDRYGIKSQPRVPINTARVFAAILAIAAVVIAGSSLMQNIASAPWLLLLPLAAGVGTSWQAAVNGELRVTVGDSLVVTLLNFTVGGLVMLLVAAGSVLIQGFPGEWPINPIAYCGGLFGVVYVGLSAYLVRRTGVLVLGLAIIVGQLLASLLLDYFLPLGPSPGGAVVVGVVVAVLAVVFAITSGKIKYSRSK